MAVLDGITFTGTMGGISGYRMHGSDKHYARKKGGASKKMIMTSPKFELPRRYMSEFGGCSTMGRRLRLMMTPVKRLADYNISGPILKLLKVVQKQDTTHRLGQRSIVLSQYTQLLEGFSLNRRTPFDTVIRNPLAFSFIPENKLVRVDIPTLMREINFFPQNRHPLFNITISVGIVPDFSFNESTGKFEPPAWYTGYAVHRASTPWHATQKGSPATTVEVALKNDMPPDASYSLMVSVGVEFGTLYDGGIIEPVKRSGAAKILALRAGNTLTTVTPNGHDAAPVEETVPVVEIAKVVQTPKQEVQAPKQELKAEQVTTYSGGLLVGNVNTTGAETMFVYTLREERGEGNLYSYEVADTSGESPKVGKTESPEDNAKCRNPIAQRAQRRHKVAQRETTLIPDTNVNTYKRTDVNTLTPT